LPSHFIYAWSSFLLLLMYKAFCLSPHLPLDRRPPRLSHMRKTYSPSVQSGPMLQIQHPEIILLEAEPFLWWRVKPTLSCVQLWFQLRMAAQDRLSCSEPNNVRVIMGNFSVHGVSWQPSWCTPPGNEHTPAPAAAATSYTAHRTSTH
jgi:hypothetical protein